MLINKLLLVCLERMKLRMVFVRTSRDVQVKSPTPASPVSPTASVVLSGGQLTVNTEQQPQQQQQQHYNGVTSGSLSGSNGSASSCSNSSNSGSSNGLMMVSVPSSPVDNGLHPCHPASRSLVPSCSAPQLPAALNHGLDSTSTHSAVSTVNNKLSPDKESLLVQSPSSPKRHKVRKDRFHKLFPDVAETDLVIKSYHCAYVSDILLQGFLYVTKNWFCFYSKLLGKKRIKICVDNVTSITKTKTAIIIPNAVSIVTETNQFVFGSLMSRDNTFRVLHSIWQQKIVDLEQASAIDIDAGSDATADDSLTKSLNAVSSNSSTDDFVTSSSSDDNFCSDLAGSCDKLVLVGTNSVLSEAGYHLSPTADNDPQSTVKHLSETPLAATRYDRLYNGVRLKQPYTLMVRLMQWLNSLPRTSLFLLVSTVLVLLLLISAGLLTYKLLHLQAQLDASLHDWTSADNTNVASTHQNRLATSMYAMRHDYQQSAVQQIHSVLEAHVQLLDQVNEALKGLYVWASKTNPALDHSSKHAAAAATSSSSSSNRASNSNNRASNSRHESL